MKYGEATAMPAKRMARIIQNLAATRLFVMAATAENFIRVWLSAAAAVLGCAFEECELNAACAAYGVIDVALVVRNRALHASRSR